MPWQQWDGGRDSVEAVKVEDMMLLVDTMLENTSTDDEKVGVGEVSAYFYECVDKSRCSNISCVFQVLRSPTRFTLSSMVSHFQKLFDVTSLSGVYPRMNEVYTRLGVMTNTMRNLRDVLDLGTLQTQSKLRLFIQFQ